MLLENPPHPHNFSNGPSLKESKSSRGGGGGGQKRYFYIRGSMCVLAKMVTLRP